MAKSQNKKMREQEDSKKTGEEKINFLAIEQKWQKEWEKAKCFEIKENSKKKKYYVLEMFPYPSASGLHMGHALNYTIGDIFARFKRMQGMNVLYPMGYDAFGLPAENAAIKENEHPKKYTDNSMANFEKQQKALGLSYDWNRIVKTCEPEYYKWNQYFFLKFLENGLVYRKKSAVNYCKKCNTVLANEQVHNGKCWRHEDTEVEIKHLEQWFVKTTKYSEELLNMADKLNWPERIKLMQKNWIGKSNGVEIDFIINDKKWRIFTTRPDTIHGVTFMVISSQHEKLFELVTDKQKKEVENFLKKLKAVSEKELEEMEKEGVFTGSYAINPLTKEKIPVYAGNFVVADYGSGMVMAVPGHDERDFQFAKKYKLPIKRVIEDKTKVIAIKESLKPEFYNKASKIGKINYSNGLAYIYTEKVDEVFDLAKNNFIGNLWYIHSEGKIKKIMFHTSKENKIFDWSSHEGIDEAKIYGRKIRVKEEQLDFNEVREAYTNEGEIVNSGKFDGINSKEAIDKISEYIEKQKLGKKTLNYKLRDWLVSRQRYWGTPIPVVYCSDCGIVAVPEKKLPVLLPEKVKFGKGNPLASNKEFVNTKCPKCRKTARRETDTMDTFFDSSWYFLRYCDNKNKKEAFDRKKAEYWMPVEQYIGGAEHACMHLIYARFFTKALRDMGMLKFDEPFTSLFNQGMLHGNDGNRMSKSLGNVINPSDIIEKYSADALRFNLMSLASPDKDSVWSDSSLESSFKFISKIYAILLKIKIGKSLALIESKYNRAVKEITNDIANFNYNLAIIKLRELFEKFSDKESKEIIQGFLKLLSVFAPHIAEELWHKIGNKSFISLEKWPIADESKIDENLEKEEKQIEKLIEDIRNILRILEARNELKNKKSIKIFAIPKELSIYKGEEEKLRKIFNLEVEVLSVQEASKTGKVIKANLGKPGILVL